MAGVLAGGITDAEFLDRKKALKEKGVHHLVELVTDRDDGGIYGYCVSSICGKNVGEIDSIYLDEGLRRSGLGRKLIQRAMNWMDENGVSRKRVLVMVMNEPARKLYEEFGFVPRQVELFWDSAQNLSSR